MQSKNLASVKRTPKTWLKAPPVRFIEIRQAAIKVSSINRYGKLITTRIYSDLL